MRIETHLPYEIANGIVKEISKDRMENDGTNAQQEAQPQRRRFSLVAAFTRLFQRRESVQTPAPETHTQSRTV